MLAEAYKSVTDEDPWTKAESLIESGMTMQQVPDQATFPAPDHSSLALIM